MKEKCTVDTYACLERPNRRNPGRDPRQLERADRVNREAALDKEAASKARVARSQRKIDTCDVFSLPRTALSGLNRHGLACTAISFSDSACRMCERTVSVALDMPLAMMQSPTRSSADVALARQIAMYLSHTVFGLLLTEVGVYFNRDRTTVSHACSMIEDRRDDATFDLVVAQLETILLEVRHMIDSYSSAMTSVCYNGTPRDQSKALAGEQGDVELAGDKVR